MTKCKKLPKGWRWVALTEPGVVEVDPTTNPPREWDAQRTVSFLPMALVDETNGTVRDFEEATLSSCRRGRRRFQNGDVLFAKIHPCVQNGKIAYIEELRDPVGFGSTEFYVLRAGASILAEYLWFYLRTTNVIKAAVASFTGTSGRQRVPSTFWDNLRIPLPLLVEQERIVEVLRQADAIRRKRAEARRLSDQILPALFLAMFGDPNKSSFHTTLDSCATIRRGISKRPNPQGNTPIIRIKNLSLAGLVYEAPVLVLADEDDIGRGRLEDGDIVISPLNGSIGHVGKSDMFTGPDNRSWLLDSNLCVIRAKPQKAVPLWLETWLKLPSTRERLREMAVKTSGGQWLINSSVLSRMEVPLPGYAAQEEFLDRYSLARTVSDKSSALTDDAGRLFSVLLSRAFTGELTAGQESIEHSQCSPVSKNMDRHGENRAGIGRIGGRTQ